MRIRHWSWLCAVLLFLLIWEWLRPLSELADVTQVYQVAPFLAAIACFILIDAFKVRIILGLLLKFAVSVMTTAYFFHQKMIWDKSWWSTILTIIGDDVHLLKQGQWLYVSGEMRTILFLFGWAMILTAVFMIMVEKYRATWFAALTLLYLLGVHTFWGVEVAGGVLRTLIIGVILSSAGHFTRLNIRYGAIAVHQQWSGRLKWGLSCLILIGLASPVAYVMAEQYAEELPLGFSLITSEMPAVSGYEHGDVQIGGPVKLNDELIFTALTPVPTYWRGESLHTYNGKGWESAQDEQDRMTIAHAAPAWTSAPQTADTIKQVITFDSQRALQEVGGTIFSGGRVKELYMSDEAFTYEVVIHGDQLYRNKHMDEAGLEPDWFNGVEMAIHSEGYRLTDEERERYLQIPDEMPQRVNDLARSVVGKTADPIVQIERIEHFLRRTYSYTLEPQEVAAERDVVDAFLFEQMEGYCNHFSTAMVMMLRSLGIPARWVKGFAPGDLAAIHSADDGQRWYEYNVRQEHAHSWVEAFIPGMGWKVFEPTPLEATQHDQDEQLIPPSRPGTDSRSLSSRQMALVSQFVQGFKQTATWFLEKVEWFRSKFGVVSFVGMFVGSGISGFVWWVRLQLAKRRASDWMAWRWLFRKLGRPAKGQTLREYVMSKQSRFLPEQKKHWMRKLQDFERKYYGPKN